MPRPPQQFAPNIPPQNMQPMMPQNIYPPQQMPMYGQPNIPMYQARPMEQAPMLREDPRQPPSKKGKFPESEEDDGILLVFKMAKIEEESGSAEGEESEDEDYEN